MVPVVRYKSADVSIDNVHIPIFSSNYVNLRQETIAHLCFHFASEIVEA